MPTVCLCHVNVTIASYIYLHNSPLHPDLCRCGIRGGYMHMMNMDKEVMKQIYKHSSIGLCPNTPGQVSLALPGIIIGRLNS